MPEGDLALPSGIVRQRPPAYSAVRVDGERAYRRARRGEQVELPERQVTVHAFEELARDGARRTFSIRCSAGTYVRSLVADLGDAYCEQLRRTAIGPFAVADADPERIVPLSDALGFMPEVRLAGEDARRASHGVAVPSPLPPTAACDTPDRRGRPDRDRRAARGGRRRDRAEADRRPARLRSARRRTTTLPRHAGHAAPRRRPSAAPRGDRRVRRRPPRPSRRDRRQRHRPHVRTAPARDRQARGGAEAADDAAAQGGAGRRARRRGARRDPVRRRVRAAEAPRSSSSACSSSGCRRRMWRSARTSASATARRATPRCCAPTARFETRVVPLVEVAGEVVSSSHIRGLVLAGEVDQAAVFLGEPFAMRGEVVTGDRRGRELGFPTANLVPNQSLIQPGHGIYAARASFDGAVRCAAVNVGVRPTFKTDLGRARGGLPARLGGRSLRPRADDRVPATAARRAALCVRRGARRADACGRLGGARDLPGVRRLRRRRSATVPRR